MRIARNVPMNAGLGAVEESQDVAEFALLQLYVERGGSVALEPLAAQQETAETAGARRAIRARGFGMDAQRPRGLRRVGRPEVHVRVQQVEQRFRIAKLKIDTPAAHVDAGERRQRLRPQERPEIPYDID